MVLTVHTLVPVKRGVRYILLLRLVVVQSEVVVIEVCLVQVVPDLTDVGRCHVVSQVAYVRGVACALHVRVDLVALSIVLTCRLVQRVHLRRVSRMVNRV